MPKRKIIRRVPAVDQRWVEVQDLPGATELGFDCTWDVYAGPDGRVYMSCCSEGFKSLTARLYAYDSRAQTMRLLFDVADATHVAPGAIPQSKIHTAITAMEDGRLIMCTHTTAPAAGHPLWAPFPCYHDLYEGYPGSHILVYDPRTERVEDLGMPAPRESTYGGGVYIPEVRQYFMLTLIRGHLLAFSVATGKTRDLGFVGLGCRLFRDAPGRVYGIAPYDRMGQGRMYRYDPFRDRLEDVPLAIPGDPAGVLSHAAPGPDSRIYLSRLYWDHILAYDAQGETLTDLGPGFPGADRYRIESLYPNPRRFICGLCFLPDGKLYYGVTAGSLTEVVAFMRWDVLGGSRPECLGFIYGGGAAAIGVAEMVCGPDGRAYAAANMGNDRPPRLIILDGVKMRPAGPRSPSIPRRWYTPRWTAAIRRQQQLQARSADDTVADAANRFTTVRLYPALLPAGTCAVCGLGMDRAGRLHIGTRSGAVVRWDGKAAAVIGRHAGGFSGFIVADSHGYAVDERGLWRYETKESRPRFRCLASFPRGMRGASLRAGGNFLYGLLEPGFRPFVFGGGLWIGARTGNLVPGARALIQGADGSIYGALDEGVIFILDPCRKKMRRTSWRLPGLKGREFLAHWTAAVAVGTCIYGGTSDGYLFRLEPGKRAPINLGKPDLSLGITDLTAVGTRLIGISGRGPDDLCRLFAYTPDGGFESLGRLEPPYGLACVAALPDGRIAVGGGERIAAVQVGTI